MITFNPFFQFRTETIKLCTMCYLQWGFELRFLLFFQSTNHKAFNLQRIQLPSHLKILWSFCVPLTSSNFFFQISILVITNIARYIQKINAKFAEESKTSHKPFSYRNTSKLGMKKSVIVNNHTQDRAPTIAEQQRQQNS